MSDPVVANVIVGGASLWYAPVAEALPDETTIGYGVDWGGNWAKLGYTKAPLVAAYETDEFEVEVEEELGAIDRIKVKESFRLETTLAELAAEYIALASGKDPADVTTTAPGVGQVGFDQFGAGGSPYLNKWSFGFEGRAVNAAGDELWIRLFIHKGTINFNGNLEFSNRNTTYPGIAIQIKALIDPTQSVNEKLFSYQHATDPGT